MMAITSTERRKQNKNKWKRIYIDYKKLYDRDKKLAMEYLDSGIDDVNKFLATKYVKVSNSKCSHSIDNIVYETKRKCICFNEDEMVSYFLEMTNTKNVDNHTQIKSNMILEIERKIKIAEEKFKFEKNHVEYTKKRKALWYQKKQLKKYKTLGY